MKKKISKFTYISTWAVNSYNKKMYDITKKTTEEIVIHYIKRKGMDARILRLATFYGGGMASEGCINVFADKAKGGLPAPVIGDGWEIRQFTHVEDITRAVVLTHEKAPCRIEPYVATCKEVININDLAKGICGSIERLPSDDDPENYDVLSSKDIEDLGWKQEISLEEGIRRKIEDD